ncbi:DUF2147 domain-containing protein [Mesonia sp. MT50]|uniref:DUF2147 domain-containing protein n=1 Tax=Mesonia profundi TaxID=3070998 RepID=A0ABU1A4U8_9FLAO|nr:DUF2147 domain-containing protein [Mesonia profundi]MDQ7918629.1 DUF2147 domain-containing protein [Mesonia profundi]
MKYLFLTFTCLFLSQISLGQSVLGKWKVMKDEETGEVRSIINIYEDEGKVNGELIEIMDKSKENNLCSNCEGENKNKRILGLILLKDFEKDQDEYVDGTVLNPNDGKIYKSKIWIDQDHPNVLNVRGYIGIFYKTMKWRRLLE